MTDGYERVVSHIFTLGGEVWEVTSYSPRHVCISETEKNGQEDTHVSFTVCLRDGVWAHEDAESTRDDVKMYRYVGLDGEILAYVTTHGPPND